MIVGRQAAMATCECPPVALASAGGWPQDLCTSNSTQGTVGTIATYSLRLQAERSGDGFFYRPRPRPRPLANPRSSTGGTSPTSGAARTRGTGNDAGPPPPYTWHPATKPTVATPNISLGSPIPASKWTGKHVLASFVVSGNLHWEPARALAGGS